MVGCNITVYSDWGGTGYYTKSLYRKNLITDKQKKLVLVIILVAVYQLEYYIANYFLSNLPLGGGWNQTEYRSKTGNKKDNLLSYTICDIAQSTPSSFIFLSAQAPRSQKYPPGSSPCYSRNANQRQYTSFTAWIARSKLGA